MTTIKITFCLRRRPELTRAAFQDYWLNQHGPLVRSVKDALRFRRYVQVHALATPYDEAIGAARGAPESFDGIAEIYWASLADLTASMTSPEGRKAGRLLLEDERKFIDLPRSPLWFNREYEIVG
jgi:uncharacterized protein (TIGR02118 family)